ncbi:hypothetical protein [Pararhodobacter sp.]
MPGTHTVPFGHMNAGTGDACRLLALPKNPHALTASRVRDARDCGNRSVVAGVQLP